MPTPAHSSVFEARSDLVEEGQLYGCLMRGVAVLAAIIFVVLGLTGVIPFDLREDWFMVVFGILAFVSLMWWVPAEFRKKATLLTRQPLLEIHSDAIVYAGSRFPDAVLTAVLHAELGHQEDWSRYTQGDAFYVHFDPSRLGYRRRDAVIDTKSRSITIESRNFAEAVRMGRALVAHAQDSGIPYVDCATTVELGKAETRLGL